MSNTTYAIVKTARRDARCVAGEVLGKGVDAYRVPHPLNAGKFTYMCLDDAAKRYDAAEVNARRWHEGYTSKDGIEYCVTATCSQADIWRALPILLYTHNGAMAQWLPTRNGFASPTYGDAHWHDKLTTLGKVVCQAEVSVTLKRDGRVLDVVTAKWTARDEAGRFTAIKSAKQGEYDGFTLLDAIDAAAQPHRIDTRKRVRKCAADVK